MPALVMLALDLLSWGFVWNPFATVRLRAQIRAGMYSRLFARELAIKPAPLRGLKTPPEFKPAWLASS
jgi:hypothetical protein